MTLQDSRVGVTVVISAYAKITTVVISAYAITTTVVIFAYAIINTIVIVIWAYYTGACKGSVAVFQILPE